jgi:hypothetical protein
MFCWLIWNKYYIVNIEDFKFKEQIHITKKVYA